ncbi:MAG: glycoside hydrolase family 127 protein [Spirochaetota bacterium]
MPADTTSGSSAAGGPSDARTVTTTITSGFWRNYQELDYTGVIPYQWRALNDQIEGAPPSHSMENFRIAAGQSRGEYDGMVFQDSDLAKWLEAAGYALENSRRDPDFPDDIRRSLEQWVKEAVDTVAAAQQPDGYLDTYFTVKEPTKRWTNLREAHELYCAGHMIEAGVAVYRGTGDRKLLDVVIRLADYIATVFGTGNDKISGYPGHQEIELALMKLYRATGERRFMELAGYFIDARGGDPNYFDLEAERPEFHKIWGFSRDHEYQQSHAPVRDQRDAVGHSVRAMYQYIAMADLAIETGDKGLAEACRALWESTTERRMYVTGGIGSSRHGERFTTDYDLPNDTAYAETCASIGLFIFANRMARLDDDASYADVAERALYNGVISGLSLDGEAYFYVNPLEVEPAVCDTNDTYRHVKYRRQAWYGCACCPPNVARILASLGDYTTHARGNTLFVDLFANSNVSAELTAGALAVEVRGSYPWDGSVSFAITGAPSQETALAVRLPGWCDAPALRVNGEPVDLKTSTRKGYAVISRRWTAGDSVELELPMEVRTVTAHPRVKADIGRVAIERGPLVYCLEEADNGANLHAVRLAREPRFAAEHRPSLLGGVTVVTAHGHVLAQPGASPGLHEPRLYKAGTTEPRMETSTLTFIPYYTWANREPGEMTVWVRRPE